MTEAPALEKALRRDWAITLAGLVVLCLLSWLYIVDGAGTGMSAWSMTRLSLFPHLVAAAPAPSHTPMTADTPMTSAMPDMSGMDMGGAAGAMPQRAVWSPKIWALIIAMWWIMMIAMMTPSAAPTILLYARAYRHAAAQGQTDGAAPTGVFAAGYLLSWLGFSIAAAVLHWVLERAGLVSATIMGSQSRWLSAGVLAAAGAYQLSPLKFVCLSHCRTPAVFLMQHWRPGAAGALRMGAFHGAYCVGCCWALMALLFVGGVMNLAWIAALAILVLAEKIAPGGVWVGRAAGVLLLAWAAATLSV